MRELTVHAKHREKQQTYIKTYAELLGVFKYSTLGSSMFNKLRFTIEITGNRNISLCWVAIWCDEFWYPSDNDSTYDTKSSLIISNYSVNGQCILNTFWHVKNVCLIQWWELEYAGVMKSDETKQIRHVIQWLATS